MATPVANASGTGSAGGPADTTTVNAASDDAVQIEGGVGSSAVRSGDHRFENSSSLSHSGSALQRQRHMQASQDDMLAFSVPDTAAADYSENHLEASEKAPVEAWYESKGVAGGDSESESVVSTNTSNGSVARIRASAERKRSSSSFSSPRVPKVKRTRFTRSGYGTLPSRLDMLGYSSDGAPGLMRSRGRSEHIDEEEGNMDPGVSNIASKESSQALTNHPSAMHHPNYQGEGNNPREYLLHEVGHGLEGGGWAERGSPDTNKTRQLRKLGVNFDQYSTSRRKAATVTFSMMAAFSFITGLTYRMASFHSKEGLGGDSSFSDRSTTSDDELYLVSNETDSASNSTKLSASLAAWYFAISSLACLAACSGSFLLLWWMSLRKRVTLSMILMMSPLILITILEVSMDSHTMSRKASYSNTYLPETIHALAGAAYGLFLPSFFSLMTPHGPNTKLWATLGTPLGNLFVEAIFATSMFKPALELSNQAVAGAASAGIFLVFCSLFVHLFLLPNVHVDHNGDSFRSMCNSLCFARVWLRRWLLRDSLAIFIASAMASMFSVGSTVVVIKLDKSGNVKLFGDQLDLVLPHGLAVSIYAFFGLMGGLMGRKLAYMITNRTNGRSKSNTSGSGKQALMRMASPRLSVLPPQPVPCTHLPVTYMAVAAVGAVIISVGYLYGFGVIQPIGIFLVYLGHGFAQNLVYRSIDLELPREANLVSYSLFLTFSFAGMAIVWCEPVWFLSAIAKKK